MVDSCCVPGCQNMQRKAVLARTSRILGLIYVSRIWPPLASFSPLTQYSLSKSESPEHNCSSKAHLPAGRFRFTISSARANNANPVRVLTTVNLYFLNKNNTIIFHESNIQPRKKTCNLAETWSILETVFQIEKKNIFHLSRLLNLVAYLIHETHNMTKKKESSTKSSPYR